MTDHALKTSAFKAWLQQRGTAEEKALYDENTVLGFFMAAAEGTVGEQQVAQVVNLAAAARMPPAVVEGFRKLGRLVIEFEGNPTGRGKPPPLTRREQLAVVAGILGLGLAGLGAWYATRGREPDRVAEELLLPPEPPPPPPPTIDELTELDLPVHFPPGWRRAEKPASWTAGAADGGNAVVLYGEEHPEHQVLLGVLPRGAAPDGGWVPPTDEALLRWTRTAEQGAASYLTGAARKYLSAGCEVVTLRRGIAGRCLGAASTQDGRVWLQTWVRVGQSRAVLAVFSEVSPLPDRTYTAEMEKVVASLVP